MFDYSIFDRLLEEACQAISNAKNSQELSAVDIKFLGRKGLLAQQMTQLKDIPAEQRPEFGKRINEVKSMIESKIAAAQSESSNAEFLQKLADDAVDITLPASGFASGKLHPLTQTMYEIMDVFVGLGFSIEEGPEIEDEWHTFDALNIPATHPARDSQDTYFMKINSEVDSSNNRTILRTHTSPVQIRTMLKNKPPLRFISPGRVYRNERLDASHSNIFHQIEGLYVNNDVTFAELKGTLLSFIKKLYGQNMELRFRPGYFPFTEPSAEVDALCIICNGKGCSVCKQTGWVEILGAGMVNPNVFKAVGYDPEKVSGFAFGLGVERIAMLKYGIDDIRLFYENDQRFLNQF